MILMFKITSGIQQHQKETCLKRRTSSPSTLPSGEAFKQRQFRKEHKHLSKTLLPSKCDYRTLWLFDIIDRLAFQYFGEIC